MTFDRNGTVVDRDFRTDLAPRSATAQDPRVARATAAGCLATAWRDNQTGRDGVYARIVCPVR